jgi:hypothetical protein
MNTPTPPSSHTLAIPDPTPPQPDKPLRVSTRTPIGEIYIDRGQALPDHYPGLRLQVLVRDPGTIFVYWEPPDAITCDGWVLVARDADDQVLQTLRVPFAVRQGYLYVAALEVVTVSLYPAEAIDIDADHALLRVKVGDAAEPLMIVQAPAADWTGAWSQGMDRWAVLSPPLPSPEEGAALVVSVASPLSDDARWEDNEDPSGASRPWSGSFYDGRGEP